MRSHNLYRGIGIFFLVLGITIPGLAGEPTEKIKKTTDRILSIVANPALKDPSRAKARKRSIRSAVDEQFDWEEMARRSLGRHWDQRTSDEKKEFVRLFADLLDRTYMNKVEGYSGEKVRYEGETIDGNYASVKMKIVTKQNKDIPVEYRLKKEKNDWFVYDVSIEGVSLVNNYRTQFNSIIVQSSYENLVKKLREKVAQD
ncbi:MAG TPA: ABC transporter substrate-binding protein [Thermodesulfobacteriota bacterium]|nr:ABC transporter substrate-binding protein [Thermodesulfobacteriota bacterium]